MRKIARAQAVHGGPATADCLEEMGMDAAVAGLLGAAIGAFAGVIGSTLAAWQQNRAERERRRAVQLDEFVKAQRQALLHLGELVAIGSQAMLWAAWAALNKSGAEVHQEIDAYEAQMRELLPKLLAAQAEAGSISDDAYERVNPLVDELHDFGHQDRDSRLEVGPRRERGEAADR